MDSSPDLSLKLRRGSSDSRDSFYMDFAQGIDSDIEEVDTTIIAKPLSPPKILEPIPPTPPLPEQSSEEELPPPQLESELPNVVEDVADGETTSNDADDDDDDDNDDDNNEDEEKENDSNKEIQSYLPQDSQTTTSPSSSPSPPPTPPPCPPLSVAPRVPLPLRPLDLTPPGSPSLTSALTSYRTHQVQQPHPTGPTTPPDVQSDVDPEIVLSSVAFQIGDDTTEESSTTITTPPSNGFASSSSVITPITTANIIASINEHSISESEASLIAPAMSSSPAFHHDDCSASDGIGTPVGRQNYHDELHYLAQQAIHSYQSTSPMSSANILIPSESPSHSSSPAKSSSRLHSIGSGQHSLHHHRVTIDESKLPMSASSTHHHLVTIAANDPSSSPGSSQHPLTTTTTTSQTTNITATQTGHLALMYHHHQLTNYPVLPAIKRPPSRPPYHYDPHYTPVQKIKAGDALATLFSALYGKLLVVMGIAFPMAEVISTYIPPSFYEVFYLYLYIGSMLFLFFMYGTLLWGRPKIPMGPTSPSKSKKRNSSSASDSMDESDTESSNSSDRKVTPPPLSARRPSLLAPLGRQHHYGSFYLRMGAVAFGIGSMIYSGLEFGQYFELERDTKCHNVMLALTPATRMAFIFIQMYFIFLNNEQIKVYRHKILARFGLMHMIGTNLAVWLNVLIQETKHEILTFYNPENRTLRISHRLGPRGYTTTSNHSAHFRTTRGLKGPYQIFECRRTNILGTLVQDASPFLFPCTIEYSLICAAILYVMWRSISRPQSQHPVRTESAHSTCKRSPHHYSVDCARAHKGLFVGILILVLTIISLILFFVLISRPDFISLAVTEVTICELFIYGTATIATLVGMVQIRHLEYDAARSFGLDDILLVGAQTGSFLYNTFTVIAGHFTLRRDTILILVNALASIVQTACQTMFILDASRRQAVSPEHIRKKPGREIVTFMLVVNLAMWAISTLEKSRAESHPIQLNFYGLWAWTIITHVSMPLAIFYRFHSTVCLCEIWKRAYKLKPTYM